MRTEHNFIRTYTGRQMWPLEPHIEDIDFEDICHSLSLSNRFTGHTFRPYSVAEHSLLVCQVVGQQTDHPETLLMALLHDASEAYLCDIARPVKHDPQMSFYREAEDRLQTLIYYKARITTDQIERFSPIIKQADDDVLAYEFRYLMANASFHASKDLPFLDRHFQGGEQDWKRVYSTFKDALLNQMNRLKQRNIREDLEFAARHTE